MTLQARRYQRRGVLAIDPAALLEYFMCGDDTTPENEERPEATIVKIRGPLDQHDEGWFDSYESIRNRVAAACESSAPAILLLIDSPGGDAAGAFETARELREMAAAARKGLFAYVDGKACSAGYALASAATQIIQCETAIIGSIGVLSVREDFSAANVSRGLRFGFIASGARKADGHPDLPMTEAEVTATQALVDSMAQVFFDLVAEHRGVSSDQVAALQAACMHGGRVIASGLADATQTLAATLAAIAASNGTGAIAMSKPVTGSTKPKAKAAAGDGNAYQTAREALEQAAEGDDANAERAREALAVLTGGGGDDDTEPAAPEGDPQSAEADDDKPGAEADDDKPGAEADDDKPGASSAVAIALRAEKRVMQLKAELKAEKDANERERLIAAHPGLSASMVALLKKSPLALVRETLADIDADPVTAAAAKSGTAPKAKAKPGVSASQAKAGLTVKPTQGVTASASPTDIDRPAQLPQSESEALRIRMGLVQPKSQVISSDFKLTLGHVAALKQPLSSTPSGEVPDIEVADPVQL